MLNSSGTFEKWWLLSSWIIGVLPLEEIQEVWGTSVSLLISALSTDNTVLCVLLTSWCHSSEDFTKGPVNIGAMSLNLQNWEINEHL